MFRSALPGVADPDEKDPRVLTFERVCTHGKLNYRGRPLNAIPFEDLQDELPLHASMFMPALVVEYLRLQLSVYRVSERVRSWMAEECTPQARDMNDAAADVPGPHHLWVRGDEIVGNDGRVTWAEQEIDDGSLGMGSLMESVFLGTSHYSASYAGALLSQKVGCPERPVTIVVSASYGPYLPSFQYFASEVRERHGAVIEILFEGDPCFRQQLSKLIEGQMPVHNFFESHRDLRFYSPHWEPLFNAWRQGHIPIWPAPATLYEWKAWPVVFHQPELLEEHSQAVLLNSPYLEQIREHLPRSVFLSPQIEETMLSDREGWVLKPSFGGGSYGVRAGAETWTTTLRKMFRKGYRSHQYIVQDYAPGKRVAGMYCKVSPHYFFAGPPRPMVVHVMLRPSRIVHGQGDTLFSVTTLDRVYS